jgi:hypothetical protein
MLINENGISRLVWSRKWGVVNYIAMLIFSWISACCNIMNIENFRQKMLGQDSLHKGSSCEMTTLVDLVNRNVEYSSWTWMEDG